MYLNMEGMIQACKFHTQAKSTFFESFMINLEQKSVVYLHSLAKNETPKTVFCEAKSIKPKVSQNALLLD